MTCDLQMSLLSCWKMHWSAHSWAPLASSSSHSSLSISLAVSPASLGSSPLATRLLRSLWRERISWRTVSVTPRDTSRPQPTPGTPDLQYQYQYQYSISISIFNINISNKPEWDMRSRLSTCRCRMCWRIPGCSSHSQLTEV